MDNSTRVNRTQTIVEDIIEAKEVKLSYNNTTGTKRRNSRDNSLDNVKSKGKRNKAPC
jgi:hypothetical protein